MAHTKTGEQQASRSRPLRPILSSMATLIATARRRWRARATLRSIAELTPEQLDDIGWPDTSIVLDIKAGLIANDVWR